jgi:hypothetical protein
LELRLLPVELIPREYRSMSRALVSEKPEIKAVTPFHHLFIRGNPFLPLLSAFYLTRSPGILLSRARLGAGLHSPAMDGIGIPSSTWAPGNDTQSHRNSESATVLPFNYLFIRGDPFCPRSSAFYFVLPFA